MVKVVRDGKVAILVSYGHGAGWSTWNNDPECLTHPDIVDLVERGAAAQEIEDRADVLWPDGYWGGADGLEIRWLPEGTAYKIEEYDGAESLVQFGQITWRIA